MVIAESFFYVPKQPERGPEGYHQPESGPGEYQR